MGGAKLHDLGSYATKNFGRFCDFLRKKMFEMNGSEPTHSSDSFFFRGLSQTNTSQRESDTRRSRIWTRCRVLYARISSCFCWVCSQRIVWLRVHICRELYSGMMTMETGSRTELFMTFQPLIEPSNLNSANVWRRKLFELLKLSRVGVKRDSKKLSLANGLFANALLVLVSRWMGSIL